jgi:hypothetical protein
VRRAIRYLVYAVVLAFGITPAAAQPVCDACARGDALIQQFSLEPMRPLARELAGLPLVEPLTAEQYTRVVELRTRNPALVRLGAVGDTDLALIASALCRAPSNACTAATATALRCLADRCALALPPPDPRDVDMPVLPTSCKQRDRRSPRVGLGFDWGTGWQRSKYPHDGRVWSLGIEGRMRIKGRIGAVARVDRTAGRDEATDSEGNGVDDTATGSIVRVDALAGPSFFLDYKRFESTTRSLRLDLLGGYIATRSPGEENGPAAGADLAFQLWSFRMGARFVQGFAGASDATTLLGHLGFVVGSGPQYSYDDCGEDHSSRLALGFDVPFGGAGLSSQLGYMAAGIGIEAMWFLTPKLDVVTRADLLVFPGQDRDRVIHQALLGGLRIDHGKRGEHSSRNGWTSTATAGYSHGAATTTTTVGSVPVGELSVGWGRQGRDGAIYLRLHGRFGLDPDSDYRVLFLSTTFELRFDSKRWRDRV